MCLLDDGLVFDTGSELLALIFSNDPIITEGRTLFRIVKAAGCAEKNINVVHGVHINNITCSGTATTKTPYNIERCSTTPSSSTDPSADSIDMIERHLTS